MEIVFHFNNNKYYYKGKEILTSECHFKTINFGDSDSAAFTKFSYILLFTIFGNRSL